MGNNGSKPLRILLVDDDSSIRNSLKLLLGLDYEVEAVVDGVAALAAIRQQVPDLILADVLMPRLAGIALLQKLRADPKTQEVPIILLSALADEESRISGLDAGADDYIIKPFSSRELLARIKANLRIVRLRQEVTHCEQELQTQAQAAEANLSSILSCIKDQFLSLDREWRYTYVNERVLEVTGLPREQLLGKSIWKVFPDIVGSQFDTQVHQALATQTTVQFDYYYPPLQRWFENHVYPAENGISILVTDISERKQAEKVLRENQQWLNTALKAGKMGSWQLDLTTGTLAASDTCKANYGHSPKSNFAYQDLFETIHADDLARVQAAIQQAIETDTDYDVEYRCVWSDGSIHWVLVRGRAIYNPDGKPLRIAGVSIDITERKQTEAALSQSEERFRLMAETIQDVFWVADFRVPQILYVSPAYEQIWGCSRDSLYSDYAFWLDTIHPDDRERVRTTALTCLEQDVVENEYRIIRPNGSIRWIRDRGFALRDETGQIYEAVGIAQDITERKQAEVALREAYVQLESALVAGAVYTWRWQIPSNRVIVNAAFAHLFAVDPVDAATEGLPLEMFIRAMHEEDRPRISEAINHAIETGEEYLSEYRVHTAAGEQRWVVARGRVEYDAASRPVAFPGALADITERKRAEQDRDRFFQLSRDMLAIINTDGYFLQVSPAWTQTLGYTPEELTTKPYIEFIHPEDRAATLVEAQKLAQGIPTITFENRYCCRDGSYRWILWSVAPFVEQKLLYAVARDITERKQAEAERERLLNREQVARTEAEAANRIKDEFLAVLSHELRNPLNPILGWAKLLRSRKLDELSTERALETIERNAKLQTQLIEDLLDISRILQGKLSLQVCPVNLTSTIEAALETVRLAAEAKLIKIQTVFEPNVGQVTGDPNRLQQVVWNLLSNAVKFTPSGGRVEVELKCIGISAQIQVRDSGKGIDPNFLPFVFDYFRQADSTTTRVFGGLGLGLAIVRRLVELHGGTVSAESLGVGQGATFTVLLPLMSAVPQRSENNQLPNGSLDLEGISVLVVDDDLDTRDLIVFILEEYGATVRAVASASEALDIFAHSKPDIFVSDIGMPEFDGYMLIRTIRALPPEQGGQIPALALTAYAGETDYQQICQAGFQKHVTKPVEPTELAAAIASLVGR